MSPNFPCPINFRVLPCHPMYKIFTCQNYFRVSCRIICLSVSHFRVSHKITCHLVYTIHTCQNLFCILCIITIHTRNSHIDFGTWKIIIIQGTQNKFWHVNILYTLWYGSTPKFMWTEVMNYTGKWFNFKGIWPKKFLRFTHVFIF